MSSHIPSNFSTLLPGCDPWLASYLTSMQERFHADIQAALLLVVEALDDVRTIEASAATQDVPGPWRDALRVLRMKLESRVTDVGLTRVPTIGFPLDPTQHRVESTVTGDAPAETIVSEVRPGYFHAGRVLRPAAVITIGANQPPTIREGSGTDPLLSQG